MDSLGYFNVQKLIDEGLFVLGKSKENPEIAASPELLASSNSSYDYGQ